MTVRTEALRAVEDTVAGHGGVALVLGGEPRPTLEIIPRDRTRVQDLFVDDPRAIVSILADAASTVARKTSEPGSIATGLICRKRVVVRSGEQAEAVGSVGDAQIFSERTTT